MKKRQPKKGLDHALNNEQEIQPIIDFIAGDHWWKDKEGRYLGCSLSLAQIAGLESVNQIIGKTDHQLPWAKVASTLIENDRMAMEANQAIKTEEIITTAEGKTLVFMVEKAPLKDRNEKIIGTIGTSINITERKQSQEKAQKEAERTKNEFIYLVCREIKKPIENILLFQSVMQGMLDKLQGCLSEKIFPNIHNTEKTELAEYVRKLFRDIFESHRIAQEAANGAILELETLGNLHLIQQQGIQPHWKLKNIQNLIADTIELYSDPSYEKVEFQINTSRRVPQEAVIDYANLVAVLQIIIRNAARFSPEKGIVKIKLETIQTQGIKQLLFSVQDSGSGIPEAQLKHIFSPLSHSEETLEDILHRKPSIQLPQAKLYIEAAGGSITINSTQNEGTTVNIITPYRLPEENGITKVEKNSERILLIEADPIAQQLTKNLLHQLGYHVDCANDGETAIQLGLKNNYDFAILDTALPDINAAAVIKDIRHKKADKIIFIVKALHVSEKEKNRLITAGATTILKKSLAKDELGKLLQELRPPSNAIYTSSG